MARLAYTAIASLDGYIEDASGNFDWSMPDEEVHAFVNALSATVGTELYGRKLYEVMAAWETMETEGEPQEIADYAKIWRETEKIVFSTTLEAVSSERTELRRTLDLDAIRELKASRQRDINIGGANLAASAIRAGLVDDYHLFLSPIIVGGGKRALPDGTNVPLVLVEERRFGNGVVYMHYRPRE